MDLGTFARLFPVLAVAACSAAHVDAPAERRAGPGTSSRLFTIEASVLPDRTSPQGAPFDLSIVAAVAPPRPDVDAAFAESACNLQSPQDALKRASYVIAPEMTAEEKAARRKLHHEAIAYRTRHYGHVEGFGNPATNPLEPKHYARDGRFFGIPVRMNVRALSALGCVEKAIVARCEATPYRPHVLDGLRTANTFHNDEVSNHLYGIALDVDFDTNPCCGCVARISDRPLCKKPVSSPFERTALPRCWVDTFEAFGFAWLGYDQLEDTMHFEFLGDPDRITKKE